MKIRSRMTGAALVLMLSMGGALAACGGDSDSGDTTKPSSATESTTGAEPTEDEPKADSGDDGKPSRDEVIAGYKKVITDTQAGLPGDILDQVVECFVDELYEPASAKTLQAIADADPTGVDPKDTQLFTEASTTCTKKITG